MITEAILNDIKLAARYSRERAALMARAQGIALPDNAGTMDESAFMSELNKAVVGQLKSQAATTQSQRPPAGESYVQLRVTGTSERFGRCRWSASGTAVAQFRISLNELLDRHGGRKDEDEIRNLIEDCFRDNSSIEDEDFDYDDFDTDDVSEDADRNEVQRAVDAAIAFVDEKLPHECESCGRLFETENEARNCCN